MSTPRGCVIAELEPNQWWAAVAYDEHDYQIESGEKFGPAKTEEEAWRKLLDNASNPGGASVYPFSKVDDNIRSTLKRLDNPVKYRY